MLELIAKTASTRQLDILGGFHPDESDAMKGIGTVLLLGPKEPGFWDHFTQQPEYLDGNENPVDRWSSRVITALAVAFNAQPLFPFTGPPYQPFYDWALRTGRCHVSPLNLLVHDTAGLFVSFRGALALRQEVGLPATPPSPCSTCETKPCAQACPVDAFAQGAYDVAACRDVIGDSDPGRCLTSGCRARRACPVSQGYGRVESQSAHHMRIFLENGP